MQITQKAKNKKKPNNLINNCDKKVNISQMVE